MTGVREPLRALLLILTLGALAAVPGCGSSTSTNVTAPSTDSRCQASVQGAPTSFGPSGGTGTISVGVARECGWSASSTVSWIEITSARQGQGDAKLEYRVAANAEPLNRTGGIAVAERRVDVSQEGAPCTFNVSRAAESIGPGGGPIAVNVATHSACGWTAATEAPWITVAPSSGTGSATLQLTFAVNTAEERTAAVLVAGQSLLFTQAGRPPDPPPAPNPPPPPPPPPGPPQPPAPPECTFEVSPDAQQFSALGGNGAFTLTTGAGCAWTAMVSETWLTITSGSSGAGGAQIQYVVLPNALSSNREATIGIGSATHRVRQDGLSNGDDDDDDDDDEIRIRGVVSALSGACPALQFVVNGTTVTTTNGTDFRRGNCSQVANGLEVEVRGTRQNNGQVAARSVTLFRD